jgi:hypothetical protein
MAWSISSLADKFVEDPHTVVKAGDIVKVKVLEVDLQRKRIALTMRLDEQPGDSNARRGNGGAREQATARPQAAKPRGRDAQPAGNSAMMDALAAAMGKKRPSPSPFGRGTFPDVQIRTDRYITLFLTASNSLNNLWINFQNY